MRHLLITAFIFCFFISYSQNTRSIVEDYLNDNYHEYQLTDDDVDEFVITKQIDSKSLQGKQVYIQQSIPAYPVIGISDSINVGQKKSGVSILKINIQNRTFTKKLIIQ